MSKCTRIKCKRRWGVKEKGNSYQFTKPFLRFHRASFGPRPEVGWVFRPLRNVC